MSAVEFKAKSRRDLGWTYAGTFLLCMGLLIYEIFCSRLLSVVLGSHMIFVALALAMLGLSTAGSMLSLVELKMGDGPQRDARVALLCIALGIACALSLALLTVHTSALNGQIATTLGETGYEGLLESLLESASRDSLTAGALLCLPYFMFGVVITVLFETTPSKHYAGLYFSDLAGAGLGCVLSMIVLEYGGYGPGLALVIGLPFAAAIAFSMRSSPKIAAGSAVLLIGALTLAFAPTLRKWLEPEPSLHLAARHYSTEELPERVWHAWNNYTRVEQFRWADGHQRFALAQGQGHASYIPYEPDRLQAEGESEEGFSPVSARLAALYDPESVLVLLAGVGADMIGIDALTEGKARITGVELNRNMVERALEDPSYRLDAFLDREEIDLVVAEGREFLERHQTMYDSILLSYSGASASDHMGASGGTIQFLYTEEAFQTYLEHLNPGGLLITLNLNKLQQVSVLRAIFDRNEWTGLEDSIVILRRKWDTEGWAVRLDGLHLVYRKGGFDEQGLAELQAVAESKGYEIAYGPGVVQPEYRIFHRLVTAPDHRQVVKDVSRENLLNIAPTPDDRPYALWMMPGRLLLDPEFWRNERTVWKPRRSQLLTLAAIMVAALVLVLTPLLLKPGPRPTRRNAIHLQYFLCLGIGFMLIETGLVMKFSLLLGNPGYSIAVVLASLILSTGLGSLASGRLFETGRMNHVRAVLGILLSLGLVLLFYNVQLAWLLALPKVAKITLSALLLVPIGFFMGQLFPQGLVIAKSEDPRLVAWAWAINGAFSTIGASLAVFIAPFFGFYVVMGIGAMFYALIWTLPIYGFGRLDKSRVTSPGGSP